MVFLPNPPEADKSLRYTQKIILEISNRCLRLFFSHAFILSAWSKIFMIISEGVLIRFSNRIMIMVRGKPSTQLDFAGSHTGKSSKFQGRITSYISSKVFTATCRITIIIKQNQIYLLNGNVASFFAPIIVGLKNHMANPSNWA
ncbi:MAG: hypothetical protein SRB2_00927 [Desulfobacteraceae bacterium Eth-SRB2]|nr:MAG: hypothetical protein SRB2_00927 [Desulfobacteraceae bacterium Eth-SRB2]